MSECSITAKAGETSALWTTTSGGLVKEVVIPL